MNDYDTRKDDDLTHAELLDRIADRAASFGGRYKTRPFSAALQVASVNELRRRAGKIPHDALDILNRDY